MSLSNRIRSLLNKKSEPPAGSKPPAPQPSAPSPSHTLEELGKLITQERSEGKFKQETMEKELQELRTSMEKLDVNANSSREAQSQALQFLQQDAEREIKYFERKLQEDLTHWDMQLKEREKSLEQAIRQGQAGQDVNVCCGRGDGGAGE